MPLKLNAALSQNLQDKKQRHNWLVATDMTMSEPSAPRSWKTSRQLHVYTGRYCSESHPDFHAAGRQAHVLSYNWADTCKRSTDLQDRV